MIFIFSFCGISFEKNSTTDFDGLLLQQRPDNITNVPLVRGLFEQCLHLNRCQLSHALITSLSWKHKGGAQECDRWKKLQGLGAIKDPQKLNVLHTGSSLIQVSRLQPRLCLFYICTSIYMHVSCSVLLAADCSKQKFCPPSSGPRDCLSNCAVVVFILCSLMKMKAMQVISLTLLSVLAASAQILKFGKCPKPAVQANFDATKVNTTHHLPSPLSYSEY